MVLMVLNDMYCLFLVDIVFLVVNIGIFWVCSFLFLDVNFMVYYVDFKCYIGVGINEVIKLWYVGKVYVFFGFVCDYVVVLVVR